MEFSPRAAELTTLLESRKKLSLSKKLAIYLLVTFSFLCLFFLHQEVPEFFDVKNLVASFGGGAAIYFLFCAKSYLSSVTTLFSFFMAASMLMILTGSREPELSIFILIALSSSFFLSFFWNSNRNLETSFLLIFCGFLPLIGVDWAISFLVELTILLLFDSLKGTHIINKKKIFLAFILLLPLCCYLHFIGVRPGFRIEEIFLFGTAGAGGLLFLCLNKTAWEQSAGFFIYLFSNIILGGYLKEGAAFPNITVSFSIIFFGGFLFIYQVSKIKEEALSSVIAGSKTLLRGIFFPFLYLLDALFFGGAYALWINSFFIHVLILLLFKFILQNEDQDPIL